KKQIKLSSFTKDKLLNKAHTKTYLMPMANTPHYININSI
ncbi:hypothetical protein, partial [uncultured Gammaproteobacteria bacterium]